MKKMFQKGFTLIELLVVITIIGILATGGVTVYTSQIQKARDSNRISDIKTLQSAVEQVFQDTSSYPNGPVATFTGAITPYITGLIPQDVKNLQNACSSSGTTAINCGYRYNTGGLSTYELSAAFESKTNVTSKAAGAKDGGGDNDKYETGNGIATIDSNAVGSINVIR